jgi:2-phospho-L-lactate transferase/gluconeogenesis factor (CofD/UPF0052 family)
MQDKYNICLFSGGRGASTIISALVNIEEIHLTVLLNAYDDGLSTGLLRKLVPGMLGPSDVRKTFTTVLKSSNKRGNPLLANLLEYRIGESDLRGAKWDPSMLGGSPENFWNGSHFLEYYFDNLPGKVSRKLREWTLSAFECIYEKVGEQAIRQSILDMAYGNILFTGSFIENKSDFNSAVAAWSSLFDLDVSILNITEGEHRVLVGLKENGNVLVNEASIVSKHSTSGKIQRLYLLDDYLLPVQINDLEALSIESAELLLLQLENLPIISSEAKEAILRSNMIVYGPGTQHSSLLPSYMTLGVGESIASNINAEKVFISNIGLDHDILHENHESLMENLVSYMNIGYSREPYLDKNQLITRSIISSNSDLNFDLSKFESSNESHHEISIARWGSDNYTHDGKRVARLLLTIAAMDSGLFQQESLCSISIVIPVLDEISTLPAVLDEIVTFDWLGEGYVPQIIAVDGGSTDGSWEYMRGVNGIIAIKNDKFFGRGASIQSGLSIAKGDIVVTFPADNEYSVRAILTVANNLKGRGLGIVFGSRSTLCIDTDVRLREVYGGRTREYFLSKWGGFLLSSISAIKYRRWISDPLTSIKGFIGMEKMNLSMEGHSLDWDTRIIIDSWVNQIPILEVAVEYSPRNRSQGKKTSVYSGLRALTQLLKPSR